jgi:hypothetical protein
MEELSLQVFGVPDSQIPQQIASFQTWEDFVGAGLNLRSTKDRVSWYLGLLALGVETKFGEKTIDKFAKEIGVSASSLRVYRWVVKQFLMDNPQFLPPERVSFGVLSSIAKLEPEKRQQFLEEAEDGSFSVEKARVEVQKEQGKHMKPLSIVRYCAQHDKWQWIPGNPDKWEPAHELE